MDTLLQALDFTAAVSALISVGAAVIGVSVTLAGIRLVLRTARIPADETWEEFKERVRREHGWDEV